MTNWSTYKRGPRCHECTLREEPGPCGPEGDPRSAKLIYIAQQPGQEEINVRRPLVGPSGRIFNRQLFEASVPRSHLFITNQVKCLPPGHREPTDHEVRCCQPILDAELARCRADTVVLAGAKAFEANIGSYSSLSPDYRPSTSIFERMGCVEQKAGRKWIGTINPAAIMRMVGTPARDEVVKHLRKAYALAGVSVPLPTIITNPTDADVQRHKDAAREGRMFADDCESVWLGEALNDEDLYGDEAWQMDMCGFSAIPYEAIVLPRKRVVEWTEVWADPSLLQVEHNGEYDRFYLEAVAPQRNARYDTMLGHHLLHNNEHKYLKPECLRYYTNLPYYNRDIEKQVGRAFYCGMDNVATLLVAQEQLRRLKADVYIDSAGLEGRAGASKPGRLHDLYFGTAFEGEPGLGEILPLMEEQRRTGIRIDMRAALLFKRVLTHIAERAQTAITELIGPNFNWRSYAPGGDVQTLFYDSWGLPKQYKVDKRPGATRGARKVTCDADAREKLGLWISDGRHPDRRTKYATAARYFDLVHEAARAEGLMDYLGLISPRDHRIHALQKATGTGTYRISSKPNTQNWPEWPICEGMPSMRSLVVADNDDDLLLVCDFDQVELWTYAVRYNMKYLLKIYESGDYIYGKVYEDVMGKPFFKDGLPRTKKNKRPEVDSQALRDAKTIPLGLLYGRGGEAIAEQENWPTERGRLYEREWHALNPELKAAHSAITYEMTQKRLLRPQPGMKCHFPAPDNAGLNVMGQTPAAILLWTSMILINRAFKQQQLPNTRIILSVHDMILINVGGAKSDPARLVHVHDNIVHPILSRSLPWMRGFRYRHSADVGEQLDWQMTDYETWKERAVTLTHG